MTSLKSNIRNIVIFVVIGLVLVFVYLTFFKGGDSETPALVGSTVNQNGVTTQAKPQTPKEAAIAKDFLALLLSVKNITLNDSIFSDLAFTSLRDSSILLVPDGNEGRPNPFAPIGTDALYTPPASSTPISTPPPVNNSSQQKTEDVDLGFNLDFDTSLDGIEESLVN